MRSDVKVCRIDGCEGKKFARSMCSKHYSRLLRHGSPHIARAVDNGKCIKFIKSLPRGTKKCIKWPFSFYHDGYGSVKYRGTGTRASRAVAIIHHGNPPTKRHEAAHNCGNEWCVNPDHIRWATHTENLSDMIKHGTRRRGETHGMSKLTEDQVRYIKRNPEGLSGAALARKFNVGATAIWSINSGRTWWWLK